MGKEIITDTNEKTTGSKRCIGCFKGGREKYCKHITVLGIYLFINKLMLINIEQGLAIDKKSPINYISWFGILY